MIEKVRKIFDKGGTFGTLLTNLSKACDCVTHSVPVAKLCALNFDMNPSNLVSDYLTGRNQKVNQLQFQLISGYIPMYPAKINFRTTIIHSIALSLIFIC